LYFCKYAKEYGYTSGKAYKDKFQQSTAQLKVEPSNSNYYNTTTLKSNRPYSHTADTTMASTTDAYIDRLRPTAT
jgi:hypothetical protein